MPLEQSILKSTKKVLHIGPEDGSFDQDIMTHINSAFSTLHDMGVGPLNGFVIEDEEAVWADFIAEAPVQLSQVKTFVMLSVRLSFDPPQTTHLLAAAKEQLAELTWRISVRREEDDWVDPDPESALVVDGGDPSGT